MRGCTHRGANFLWLAGTALLLSTCSGTTTSPPKTAKTDLLPASLSLSASFVDEWIANDPPMLWNWGEFVMLYGFVKLDQVRGGNTVMPFVQKFIDNMEELMYQPTASDLFSPATLVLLSCEQTGRAKDCEMIPEFDDYFNTVKREDGILVHWTGMRSQDRQIWIDTLFMVGTYMIEKARSTEGVEQAYWLKQLVRQFVGFDEYLDDPATGLLNHAYDFAVPATMNDPGAFWGRGNGWYVASLGNLLRSVPGNWAGRDKLEALWHKRLDAILPLQTANGLWRTILNRSDAYEETSASALFAFGIAAGLNAGLTQEGAQEAVDKAIQALDRRITETSDGHVLAGVSTATGPGTVAYYMDIPVADNVPFGIGAYILASIEAARMHGEISSPPKPD